MTSFAQNLKFYREQHNLTQEELAVKARLGTKIIEKYESGEQVPNTQTILKLSTVLDVPASVLTKLN
ncbi:transcriptional regulator [Heyndrickxia sporothermodurans]|nr:transcriptional regulator [Heyndrickxia sporothermodurans]